MMERNYKHIDNVFREELGSYAEVPPPAVWEALEKRLDSAERKRPGFPFLWLWYTLAFVLVAGGAVLIWSMNHHSYIDAMALKGLGADGTAVAATTSQDNGDKAAYGSPETSSDKNNTATGDNDNKIANTNITEHKAIEAAENTTPNTGTTTQRSDTSVLVAQSGNWGNVVHGQSTDNAAGTGARENTIAEHVDGTANSVQGNDSHKRETGYAIGASYVVNRRKQHNISIAEAEPMIQSGQEIQSGATAAVADDEDENVVFGKHAASASRPAPKKTVREDVYAGAVASTVPVPVRERIANQGDNTVQKGQTAYAQPTANKTTSRLNNDTKVNGGSALASPKSGGQVPARKVESSIAGVTTKITIPASNSAHENHESPVARPKADAQGHSALLAMNESKTKDVTASTKPSESKAGIAGSTRVSPRKQSKPVQATARVATKAEVTTAKKSEPTIQPTETILSATAATTKEVAKADKADVKAAATAVVAQKANNEKVAAATHANGRLRKTIVKNTKGEQSGKTGKETPSGIAANQHAASEVTKATKEPAAKAVAHKVPVKKNTAKDAQPIASTNSGIVKSAKPVIEKVEKAAGTNGEAADNKLAASNVTDNRTQGLKKARIAKMTAEVKDMPLAANGKADKANTATKTAINKKAKAEKSAGGVTKSGAESADAAAASKQKGGNHKHGAHRTTDAGTAAKTQTPADTKSKQTASVPQGKKTKTTTPQSQTAGKTPAAAGTTPAVAANTADPLPAAKPPVKTKPEEPKIMSTFKADSALAMKTAKVDSLPAAGTHAPDSTAPAKRNWLTGWEVGVKAGYERGFSGNAAQKFVVSPYLEYKLNTKFSILLQPSVKGSSVNWHPLDGTQAYYNIDHSKDSYRYDSFIMYVIGPSDTVWRRNYTFSQTHDSVSKSYGVGGKYVEMEFPIMLKYNLTPRFSVYGGLNIAYSKYISVKEKTFTGPSVTLVDSTHFGITGNTQPTYATVYSYSGAPLSNYKGPLYPSPSGSTFRLGYMLGFSYEFNKKWMFDCLLQQGSVKSNVVGGYDLNTALSSTYFRLTLGRKLFSK